MRTLVDIPENLLEELTAFARKADISRAELMRRALDAYVGALRQAESRSEADPIDAAFGLWKDREDIGDGVEYQRRLRAEWE